MIQSAVQPRYVPVFSTPVFTEAWDQQARWNPTLLEEIGRRRSATAGVSLSNVLGWQSDVEMLTWGGEAARALRDHVVARCEALTVDVGSGGARRHRWGAEMWANVSPQGASNQTHSHPGSTWSAVYYVDNGSDAERDPKKGGELVFLDPRMPMIRMRTPDLRIRRPDGSTDHQEVWISPETGRLVLFPSWLMHSVRPHLGSRERVSIAINIAAVPISGAPVA